MNLRQKKKLFKRITGHNPRGIDYGGPEYHAAINKPWGGLKELKKQETIKSVEDFNRNIQNRNT